jgi:hypothetical protein
LVVCKLASGQPINLVGNFRYRKGCTFVSQVLLVLIKRLVKGASVTERDGRKNDKSRCNCDCAIGNSSESQLTGNGRPIQDSSSCYWTAFSMREPIRWGVR